MKTNIYTSPTLPNLTQTKNPTEINGFINKLFEICSHLMYGYAIVVILWLFIVGLRQPRIIESSTLNHQAGFYQLSSQLGTFKVFRNIGYMIYAGIFIIIGIAILITRDQLLKKSISKLVVGLILLTFSYAIAALLLDMINLAKYISENI